MECEVFFRRSGYEYRYQIGMDDEMISSYRTQLDCLGARYRRSFILEVRTNFVLKKSSSDDEQIIESERFAAIHPVDLGDINTDLPIDEVDVCRIDMGYRLREYWLPEKEIRYIAHEALCFVKRTAAEPRNASLDVIPVVVYMNVCTVQLQGELLDATVLRLIKPDHLIPFQVWGRSIVLADGTRPKGSVLSEETMAMSSGHRMYLKKLPRERVDNVAIALTRMESCPICLEAPAYGTKLTPLSCDRVVHKHCSVPSDHIFHNHCIVRWLMNNNRCPACHSEIAMGWP